MNYGQLPVSEVKTVRSRKKEKRIRNDSRSLKERSYPKTTIRGGDVRRGHFSSGIVIIPQSGSSCAQSRRHEPEIHLEPCAHLIHPQDCESTVSPIRRGLTLFGNETQKNTPNM